MTNSSCQPLLSLVPRSEREARPDRMAELLECLADLVVHTRAHRDELDHHARCDDERVQASISQLELLEHQLREVGIKAASVHQRLLHEHLM